MSQHVVILGGGFAGVYTAMYLEKKVGSDVTISLVNRENYFVFQPMLPEVISGSIEIQHIINPRSEVHRGNDSSRSSIRLNYL